MDNSEYLDLFRELIAISSKRANLLNAGEYDRNNCFAWKELYANLMDDNLRESIDSCGESIKKIVESLPIEDLRIVAAVSDIGYDFLTYKYPDDYYTKYSGMQILTRHLKGKYYTKNVSKDNYYFFILGISGFWLHECLSAAMEIFEIEL